MSQITVLSAGSITPGTYVQTLTGNTGGAVSSDGSGNINIVGSGNVTVTDNPGTNTLTITSSDIASISITGDTGGAQIGSAFTFTGGTTGITFAGASDIFTLGGTLVVANGGTGANTFTSHGVLLGNTTGAITATAAGTTGQVLTGVTGSAPTFQSPAASSITITGDTGGGLTGNSFTFTASGIGLSFGGSGTTETLSGTLKLANGGTNANLTASNGGIFYSTASAGAILAGTATANQVLLSGSSTTPAWSTATYPATTTINQLLYSSANNVIGGVTAGDYGVLISSSTGVPSWLANGTTGQLLTATTSGTPSWANAPTSGITTIDGDSGSMTGSTVTISGGTTGLTTSASSATMDLTGTLKIANGGTNATSFTQSNGIVTYNGTRLVNYAGPQISSAGVATNTTQPAFYAYVNAFVGNATGDGTAYTVIFNSTLFDQASNFNTTTGTFTAPVTGKYMLTFFILGQSFVAANTTVLEIITTANTYVFGNTGGSISGNEPFTFTVFAPMSAGDTATCVFLVSGGTKTVGVFGGGAPSRTAFHGYLVC